MGFTRSGPPKGLLRGLLNFPRWFYRVGLGRLMGKRFLMFEHTGRTSGKVYETVVEVVFYDGESEHYYIASGWGEHADWLKNIQKNPEIRVTVSAKTFEAQAIRMPPGEAEEILWKYAQQHAAAFKILTRMMLGEQLEPTRENCKKMSGAIPLIEIVPHPNA